MELRNVRPAYLAAFVVICAMLVFLPSLGGAFVWDDIPLIVGNSRVRTPATLLELLSTPFWDLSMEMDSSPAYARLHRPLVKLAYHLQFLAYGEEPFGYHVVSLVLHAACVWLVWDALRARIAGDPTAALVAATIGAALFSVHPTHAENVAWISGSTDLWMTLFWLLGMKFFRERRDTTGLVLGGVALALAGFAKELAVVAPIVVLADAVARGEERARIARETGVSVLAAVVVLSSAFLVMPAESRDVASGMDAPGILTTFGHYVRLVFWPFPATIFPSLVSRGPDGAIIPEPLMLLLGALTTAALAALVVLAVRRPPLRPWLADALWFVVPLLPVLNFVARDPNSLTQCRFLYLPVLGVCALLARGIAPWMPSQRERTALIAAAALALALSANATIASAARFASNLALWTNEAVLYPDRPLAYGPLVEALRTDHRFEEAERVAMTGATVAHGFHDSSNEAHYLLLWASLRVTSMPDTEQEELEAFRAMYAAFEEGRLLTLRSPTYSFDVHVGGDRYERMVRDDDLVRSPRAIASMRTGHLEEADALLTELVLAHPRSPTTWNLLAVTRARRGDFEGSLEASTRAEEVFPGSPAIDAVRQTVERARLRAAAPAATERELAVREAEVQMLLGAPEAARRALAPLLALSPGDHELIQLRAQVDVSDRRFDLAREVILEAQRTAPDDPFFSVALERLTEAEAQALARDAARATVADDGSR